MEPGSHPEGQGGLPVIEAQLRECFGRVVYSHKAQEKAADRCLRQLRRIKFSQILLSAVTTGGLLVAVFGDPATSKVAAILSAFLSTALLALNTYTKDVDPGTSAERHKETAAKLWSVRESYLSLLTDLKAGGLASQEVRGRRDDLQVILAAIYEGAPRTTSDSYADASSALKTREELTFSDEEIDKFLPIPLRHVQSSVDA
jgi:hypothetical protein